MSLRRRLPRVLLVVLAAALACWATTLNNADECGTVGDCLGLALDDLVVLVLAVPVGALLLRVLSVPRVLLHTLAAAVLGATLWVAAGEVLRALDPDRAYDSALPLPVWLLVGALAALAATYVVGPGQGGRRGGLARAVVPPAVLGLAISASWASARATFRLAEDRIAAVPITLYEPVIGGYRSDRASVVDDEVRLWYSFQVGERYVFVDVTLSPQPPGDDPLGGRVEVRRGDTYLVADFDEEDLDPADVREALESAEETDAASLAD